MSEEDRSRGRWEELKTRYNELLERINQEGARLHDRISERLGTPKGGEEGEEEKDKGEEGEEEKDKGEEEKDKGEEGEEDKAEEAEEVEKAKGGKEEKEGVEG